MPHRVASFFRAHAHAFDLPPDVKKAQRPLLLSNSRPSPPSRSPSSSTRTSPLPPDDRAEKSAKMPDHLSKRLSLPFPGKSPKSSTTKIPLYAPATLTAKLDGGRLTMYGDRERSTGALLQCRLILEVQDAFTIDIDSFHAKLDLNVHMKKPFHGHCHDCSHRTTNLKSETVLTAKTLKAGKHEFPFQHLIPGHLPATMDGSLSSIQYVLQATILHKGGEPIELCHPIEISRSLITPDTPRQSIRVFPPTNLTANCSLPQYIHPIGEQMLHMRMDGCVKLNADGKNQTQWKLKRLTWRLDETQKVISPGCPKHLAKLGINLEEEKKGVPHQDVRIIGSAEHKSGWKFDFSSAESGTIEFEFPFSIRPDAHPICDMATPDGQEVKHMLIVEMIVAEEFAPIKKPNQVTPTGAARVLRMHFNTVVTERAGMGVSWDMEVPPMYSEIPPSPPGYIKGQALEYISPLPRAYNDSQALDAAVPAFSLDSSSAPDAGPSTGNALGAPPFYNPQEGQ